MCGIVGGFINKKELPDKLNKWWKLLLHRGDDSYGILIFTDDKVYSAKSLYDIYILNYIKGIIKTIKEDNIFFIAHNRWATTGDITKESAHPIRYKSLYVIHNGTKESLAEAFNIEHDTRAIAMFLSVINKDYLGSNVYKNVMSKTGVVFAYDANDKLLIIHKDITRTLYYSPELNLFASEPIETGKWYQVANINKFIKVNSLKDLNLSKLLPANKSRKTINLTTIKKGSCEICGKVRILSPNNKICCNCYSKGRNLKYLRTYRQTYYINY